MPASFDAYLADCGRVRSPEWQMINREVCRLSFCDLILQPHLVISRSLPLVVAVASVFLMLVAGRSAKDGDYCVRSASASRARWSSDPRS